VADLGTVDPNGTSATGGSARSQVDEIDDRRWRPRRVLAFAITALSYLIPFACATLVVQAVTRTFGRPRTVVPFVVWLAFLLLIATVTLRLVDRQARRLLPLATMLRLSLVFPDQAPSRFALALKRGTGRALQHAVAGTTAELEFGTPQETAEAVVALIGRVGRHDRLTLGHCERVRAYSDLIGQQLGLDPESASKLHWAALLHDVGKLDVDPAILNKKGRLTPEEWEHVRQHPACSDRWLVGLTPWLGEWALAASQHHERFDGHGYPSGLAGMEISLAGRIVAVADAFDVMTAARSYKKPFPAAQARVELTDNAGTQFDPHVVRAFLAISVGELRKVMGPVAWLAAVPELLRATVTGVIEPARTAVVAAGVAAAGLAPAITAPPRLASPAADVASDVANALATPSASADTNGSTAPGGKSRVMHSTPTAAVEPVAATVPSTSLPTAGSTSTTTPAVARPVTVTTTTTTVPVTVSPVTTPATTSTTIAPTTTTTAPHPPVAVDDTVTGVHVNTWVYIDVLKNDYDPDGNLAPSTLTVLDHTPGLTLDIMAENNQIRFRSPTSYTGKAWFRYRVCDTTYLCATAHVTLTIVS
jgi:HD domain